MGKLRYCWFSLSVPCLFRRQALPTPFPLMQAYFCCLPLFISVPILLKRQLSASLLSPPLCSSPLFLSLSPPFLLHTPPLIKVHTQSPSAWCILVPTHCGPLSAVEPASVSHAKIFQCVCYVCVYDTYGMCVVYVCCVCMEVKCTWCMF